MHSPVARLLVTPFIAAVLLAIGGGRPSAQPVPTASQKPDIPKDMKTYIVALLRRGPNYVAEDTAEVRALMARHLAYNRVQAEARRYLVFGPLLDKGEVLAIAVIAAASVEEARRIMDQDPAVLAGRFLIDLHPAWLPSLEAMQVKY